VTKAPAPFFPSMSLGRLSKWSSTRHFLIALPFPKMCLKGQSYNTFHCPCMGPPAMLVVSGRPNNDPLSGPLLKFSCPFVNTKSVDPCFPKGQESSGRNEWWFFPPIPPSGNVSFLRTKRQFFSSSSRATRDSASFSPGRHLSLPHPIFPLWRGTPGAIDRFLFPLSSLLQKQLKK